MFSLRSACILFNVKQVSSHLKNVVCCHTFIVLQYLPVANNYWCESITIPQESQALGAILNICRNAKLINQIVIHIAVTDVTV